MKTKLESLIEEAKIQAEEHPSKDARWFANSVHEYLTQRQWVGLNDEERSKIWGELPQTSSEERDACVFAEAIEIYLKERNT